MGGVTRVVVITTMTTTAYNLLSTTPIDLPTEAKIKPTSPLGIIPTPIKILLNFSFDEKAQPQASFERIATKHRAMEE